MQNYLAHNEHLTSNRNEHIQKRYIKIKEYDSIPAGEVIKNHLKTSSLDSYTVL